MSDGLKPTAAPDAETAPIAEIPAAPEAAPERAPLAAAAEEAVPVTATLAPASLIEAVAPVADDDDDDDDGEAIDAPSAPAERRGPTNYVESEGGRASRIGAGVKPSDVTFKNIALLSRFLDRRGRILSRRKTRVTAKVQRRVAQAVKRARHLALLPYTADQTRVVRKRR